MLTGRRLCRAAIIAGVLSLAAPCHPNRPDELFVLVPALAPDIATHLMQDDPEELRRFARQIGSGALVDPIARLRTAPPTDLPAEFVHVEGRVAPYLARLVEIMVSDFGLKGYGGIHAAYWSRSVAERMEIVRMWREVAAIYETGASAAVRAERIERFIGQGEIYPEILNHSELYGEYASLLAELGRRDEIPHSLQRGIEAALRHEDRTMACQLLGTLGVFKRQDGDYDAMRQCWDRALTLARETGSWQEARILDFYSTFHWANGRLAIARDLMIEAQDRGRELGTPEIELRFLINGLSFFTDLGCWDIVGRGLERADIVLRECQPQADPLDFELQATRLQVRRARYLAQVGRCDEAQELALGAAERVDSWSLAPSHTASIRFDAVRALSACGLVSVALPLLERGAQECAAANLKKYSDYYKVELADACFALGDLDRCREILRTVRLEEGSPVWVWAAVLDLQLASAGAGHVEAVARLTSALQRLDVLVAAAGSSPESDITLAAHDELRRLGHDVLGDSVAAAYAFEMRWHARSRRGSRFIDPGVPEAGFMASLAAEARTACSRLADHDAVHCIYDVRDDGIVRFTASGAGIDQQRLDIGVDEVRERAQRVGAVLADSRRDQAPMDSTCSRDLRELARALLPEAMLAPSGPGLLLVSANDCLAQLPFEALNLSANSYEALLQHADVARLRSWSRERLVAGADSTLVISSPRYSDTIRRRYSILSEALPLAAAEAASVRQLLPRSIGLVGATATKANVLTQWERARVIYFAGHLIRDPDVPYLTFIPMAETTSGHEDDFYLEVADVRNADLRRCKLAVLSSCGSGMPYSNGWVRAPSLADAFIDAGVDAVVSTAWAVRDEDAAPVMDAFMRRYANGGTDPVVALCAVRRALARDTPDPRAWAAFSITIGQLPQAETRSTARTPERRHTSHHTTPNHRP